MATPLKLKATSNTITEKTVLVWWWWGPKGPWCLHTEEEEEATLREQDLLLQGSPWVFPLSELSCVKSHCFGSWKVSGCVSKPGFLFTFVKWEDGIKILSGFPLAQPFIRLLCNYRMVWLVLTQGNNVQVYFKGEKVHIYYTTNVHISFHLIVEQQSKVNIIAMILYTQNLNLTQSKKCV